MNKQHTAKDKVHRCPAEFMVAMQDVLNVLTGKWKLAIISSLIFGKKRFTGLQHEIGKITPRMLSKELKELELNGVVKRIVIDKRPVVVEYELTESGKEFKVVLRRMVDWGLEHRSKIFKKRLSHNSL